MQTITVKNISRKLHELLKRRAALYRRSLNNEIIVSLEAAVGLTHLEAGQMRLDASVNRNLFKGEATLEEIDRFKKEGRA